jgi:hypothetical protein
LLAFAFISNRGLVSLSVHVGVGIKLAWLGEAGVEEGRGAGPFQATEAAAACIAGVFGEGGSAVRVVEAQVVAIPVAAVFGEPGGGDGADEVAS